MTPEHGPQTVFYVKPLLTIYCRRSRDRSCCRCRKHGRCRNRTVLLVAVVFTIFVVVVIENDVVFVGVVVGMAVVVIVL